MCWLLLAGSVLVLAGGTQAQTTGTLTVLHTFSGADGTTPTGLIQASDGNFYGTTSAGGSFTIGGTTESPNAGTVFKLTPADSFTSLYSLDSGSEDENDQPTAPPLLGSDGYLYGSTSEGGAGSHGSIYKLITTGTLVASYDFPEASEPTGALIQTTDGNFYGTAVVGGISGQGSVFKFAATAGQVTDFYTFPYFNEGLHPEAPLLQGSDGNFYGTTAAGGTNSNGTVFQLTPGGALVTLYDFTALDSQSHNADGVHPVTGPIQGADGDFYGVIPSGGYQRGWHDLQDYVRRDFDDAPQL